MFYILKLFSPCRVIGWTFKFEPGADPLLSHLILFFYYFNNFISFTTNANMFIAVYEVPWVLTTKSSTYAVTILIYVQVFFNF